jgi:hypothetical protein
MVLRSAGEMLSRKGRSMRNRLGGGVPWHCLTILLAFAALPLPARHLPIQVYTSAQGLPRNSVECLAPSGGSLWLPEDLVPGWAG